MTNNYSKVLANYIFNRLLEIQTDDYRERHQPKLWPTGFVFTVNEIVGALFLLIILFFPINLKSFLESI